MVQISQACNLLNSPMAGVMMKPSSQVCTPPARRLEGRVREVSPWWCHKGTRDTGIRMTSKSWVGFHSFLQKFPKLDFKWGWRQKLMFFYRVGRNVTSTTVKMVWQAPIIANTHPPSNLWPQSCTNVKNENISSKCIHMGWGCSKSPSKHEALGSILSIV